MGEGNAGGGEGVDLDSTGREASLRGCVSRDLPEKGGNLADPHLRRAPRQQEQPCKGPEAEGSWPVKDQQGGGCGWGLRAG